jgi:site-specific DNA-methyltransferase (adenine-specific)
LKPFYEHNGISIYHGRFQEILPDIEPAVVIADPPYGETALEWDRWQGEFLDLCKGNSMWCFGTLRMFMDHGSEFKAAGWNLSHDLIWEKQNGTGLMNDRFRRVHEQVAHFYRGPWSEVYKCPQYTMDATARQVRRKQKPTHWSKIKSGSYESVDGGPRLERSVIFARNEHGRAVNETQKPVPLVEVLLAYSVPKGGMIVDPVMGSGTTLVAAKRMGVRAIGIDMREEQCEAALLRLSQEVMDFTSR